MDVPRRAGWTLDVDGILRAIGPKSKLVLVCSPNNPTGNQSSLADLKRLLESGVNVLVDEAYVEFAAETALGLLGQHSNLIVVRTFSKWAGLAGLRVGYGLFSDEMATAVKRVKPAYTVNAAAQAAALASLQHRKSLFESIGRITRSRRLLIEALDQLGILRPWPSHSNFVYCTAGAGTRIPEVFEQLLRRGILVRLFSQPDALRITVGTDEENRRLVDALRDIEATADSGKEELTA